MPILVETSVVGTTIISMATSWLVFAHIGPKVLRAIFPAYGKLNFDKKIVTNNAFLAMCHGAVVGPWSLYLFFFGSEIRPDNAQQDSKMYRHISAIFLGYITIDLILMLKYPVISDWSFVTHHMISIFGGTVGATYGTVSRISNIICMTEVTSPFSNMRVLLSELGLRKSHAYIINGISLLVTFFLCRIMSLPVLGYHGIILLSGSPLLREDLPLPILCCSCVMYIIIIVLNLIWFKKICYGAAKVIKDM